MNRRNQKKQYGVWVLCLFVLGMGISFWSQSLVMILVFVLGILLGNLAGRARESVPSGANKTHPNYSEFVTGMNQFIANRDKQDNGQKR